MDLVNQVQILDEAVCILHNTDTLGKGMNPIILPLAMDKYLSRLGPLTRPYEWGTQCDLNSLV